MHTARPVFTERHELFCRHMARGASGAAAARWAGFAQSNASKQAADMLARPHIRNRIEELKFKREAAREAGIADMVDRLRVLAKLATEKQDYRTVLRSIELEAKLCGLMPDRNAHEPTGGFVGADPLLDGIDLRHPTHADADTAAWEQEWTGSWDSEATPIDPQETPPETPPDEDVIDQELDEDSNSPFPGRSRRSRAIQEADMRRLHSLAPPRARNPAAPDWARHPDPLVRGFEAERHGWNREWERPG